MNERTTEMSNKMSDQINKILTDLRLRIRRLALDRVGLAALALVLLVHCKGSEVLAPSPSAQDLDINPPTCGGLSSVTVTSGPSLTVTWPASIDDVTSAPQISYYVYMRDLTTSQSYDLVSPAKIVVGATNTIITSVLLGHSYQLFVSCRDQSGNAYPSGPLNEISVTINNTTPPTTISDLAATNPSYTAILLTWSPSDGGPGGTTAANMIYKVFASQSAPVSTAGTPVATQTGKTSYLHQSLIPNTHWYYRVVAVDSYGNVSADSNQADNTTIADTVAPAFSGNSASLAMSSHTTSQIALSWTAASDNVTAASGLQYLVYRCSTSTSCNPFSAAPIYTTAAGVTTYTDNGVIADQGYVYGVRVRDASGNVSSNTDNYLFYTVFDQSGQFFAYSSLVEAGQRFGQSVAIGNVIGPINGYPDLVVGAPMASEPAPTGKYRLTGCVFIFAGIGSGQFSTTPSQTICAPSPTGDGPANQLNFGAAVVTADFDGDGNTDFFVTSPNRQRGWFYLTRDDGTGNLVIDVTGAAANEITGTSASWGTGVCAANMKGGANQGADLVVTAPGENCSGGCGGFTGNGNFYIYKNTSTSGTFATPTSPDLTVNPFSFVNATFTLANNIQAVQKCAIAPLDSRVGHQSDDILVLSSGSPNVGVLSFYQVNYSGSFSLTQRNVIRGDSTTVPSGSQWGSSVSGIQLHSNTPSYAGPSLVVGAQTDSSAGPSAGGVYIYDLAVNAGTGAFSLTDTGNAQYGGHNFNTLAVGAWVTTYNLFGHTDGTTDLIYSAPIDSRTDVYSVTGINFGNVYVQKNIGNGNISTTVSQSDFNFLVASASTNQYFGASICHGDVNNDGLDDVIVGSPYQSYDPTAIANNAQTGAVFVYYGKSSGETDFTSPNQIIFAPGNTSGSFFGGSCAVMDFNADGKKDLVVGSYGRSVGGTANRGAVYVYYGATASDIPTVASATLTPPTAVTGGINFGAALAVGDFDGNGFDDLAVGATNVTVTAVAGVGNVFVYWANNSGAIQFTNSPTILVPPYGAYGTANNPYLTNTITLNANMNFGSALAAFPTRPRWGSGRLGVDLIACAMNYTTAASFVANGSAATTNMGTCFIYEGAVNLASGGAPSNYTIASFPGNDIRHVDGAPYNNSYNFGSAMTVGKWSGGSQDDLVICSRRANSGGNADVGACYAYYGNWDSGNNQTAGGFTNYTTWRSNQAGARNSPTWSDRYYNPYPILGGSWWGGSVALADINNNGTVDLLVGEPISNQSNPTNIAPANKGRTSGRVFVIRGGY